MDSLSPRFVPVVFVASPGGRGLRVSSSNDHGTFSTLEAKVTFPALRNAPFLQHLPATLSKVDLGFLKDHIPAHELDSSGRELGRARGGGPFQKGTGLLPKPDFRDFGCDEHELLCSKYLISLMSDVCEMCRFGGF
jgi:hypothetical protein